MPNQSLNLPIFSRKSTKLQNSSEQIYTATYLTDENEAIDTGRTSYDRNLTLTPQDRRNFTKDVAVDFVEGQLVLDDAEWIPRKERNSAN